ncbi:uncharacterized protein DUF1493 [Raoultella sp. BIGb0138]|uniref:DUF1493 family protein n=1 Tax=Raoultella sp. BIGb0138 TaxID=2485115 RepID=UPI001051C640|nr:DUF1493 family protein [Raoultella sp. BIGb0138]TCW15051.1 uncharacterized protein DUF1493 [Raoultella sp. BIGb0138]
MVENIEEQVHTLIRKYAGTYVFSSKKVPLTPETDLDTDLDIDELELEDLMNEFFTTFNIERGAFDIKTYIPDAPILWNPFKKTQPIPVPDFTVGMLVESAKAGRWLYD